MERWKLGNGFEVSAIGLGYMGMSEFHGPRDNEELTGRFQAGAPFEGGDFRTSLSRVDPLHPVGGVARACDGRAGNGRFAGAQFVAAQHVDQRAIDTRILGVDA